MSVPFGFSAGDIALAIQLLLKISNALKETGGASSEYQELLHFLRTSHLILQHLENIDISKLDTSSQNAIRAQAVTVMKPIQQFLKEVDIYATSLGHLGQGSRKSILQKAKWTLLVTKKIEKLRVKFTADLQILQLLLQAEIMQSTNFNCIQLESLRHDLSRCQKNHDHITGDNPREFIALESQASILRESRGNNAILRQDSMNTKVANCSSDAVGVPTRRIYSDKGYSNNTLAVSSRDLQSLLIQLVATFRDICFCLICLTPRALCLFRRLASSVLRGPTLLLDNNIHFEDFLGRSYSLPYEWFGKWQILNGFIQHSFQGVPGEWIVERNMYRLYKIVNTNRPDMLHYDLSPGMKMKMAAAVPADKIIPLESQEEFIQNNCDSLTRTDSGGQCIDGWTALGFENFKDIYIEPHHTFVEESFSRRKDLVQYISLRQKTDKAVGALKSLHQHRSCYCISSRMLAPWSAPEFAELEREDINIIQNLRNVDLIFFECSA